MEVKRTIPIEITECWLNEESCLLAECEQRVLDGDIDQEDSDFRFLMVRDEIFDLFD